MDTLLHLLHTRPLVVVHLASALGALALGAVMLLRRKGTAGHRTLGWAWVVLMGAACASSAFIQTTPLPTLAGFSPIHALTLLVAVQLPRAVIAARRGEIARHRRAMRGLYVGGCVVAGAFALLPGRLLGEPLWRTLGALAA